MKVFISQPMAGLTDEQILERRNELIEKTREWYKGQELEFIDSFTKSEDIVGRGRIAMLGDSIAKMYDATVCIFATGWQKSSGCKVEHEVCVQYTIQRLYEDLMDEQHKPPEQKKVLADSYKGDLSVGAKYYWG
ncbi:MAG: hypothetical protein J5614_08560 [Paludibacteraceae bacterium]|nr:hypothetical protein [Paludibacteraceae bacterium]